MTTTETNGNHEVIDGYFGLCPHCHRHDGYTNVGKSHWFFCKEHRVMWCIGVNLFSSWQDETEEEQERIFNEIGLGEFEEIEPYFDPKEIEVRAATIAELDKTMPFANDLANDGLPF